MTIGLLEVSISIPEASSLKEKRSVIRSLRDRILNKMNVSVAEVGKQDQWKYADLAFVTVSAEREISQQRISKLVELLQSNPRWVLLTVHTEFL